MNKQHRYLSLVLLAGVCSGAHAMEQDIVNPEDTKDPYAVLEREFCTEQQNTLLDIVEDYENSETIEGLVTAYKAVTQLEVDEPTTDRDKSFIARRKEVYGKIVEQSVDKKAALRAVDYLSGNEDEVELQEGENPFQSIANRVLRRNRHMKAQDTRDAKLKSDLKTLHHEDGQQAVTLGKLVATIRATENKANDDVTGLKKKIKALQQEITKVDQECFTKVQSLQNEELTLRSERGITLAAQAKIEKLKTSNEESKALAEKDKTKLLATFKEMITIATGKKLTLAEQIAGFKDALAKEAVDTEKDKIRSEKKNAEADLGEIQGTIVNLKVAQATAVGTYSYAKYMLGSYN